LADHQQVYTRFYDVKHNGRKLQWQYALTSGLLKAW
jgi:hypothetical protein